MIFQLRLVGGVEWYGHAWEEWEEWEEWYGHAWEDHPTPRGVGGWSHAHEYWMPNSLDRRVTNSSSIHSVASLQQCIAMYFSIREYSIFSGVLTKAVASYQPEGAASGFG